MFDSIVKNVVMNFWRGAWREFLFGCMQSDICFKS